ncbi:hypothetical protein KUTeg_014507 [Tegillarca granosa]|uniref:Uncharacterized protein n=1 Tax=Tegillarca granosa TaxID=220873 RepID=A0ABQ9ERV0_TEGGR|nr:hypothetical protein KUTeg_014507 [Tegillarca granosa]
MTFDHYKTLKLTKERTKLHSVEKYRCVMLSSEGVDMFLISGEEKTCVIGITSSLFTGLLLDSALLFHKLDILGKMSFIVTEYSNSSPYQTSNIYPTSDTKCHRMIQAAIACKIFLPYLSYSSYSSYTSYSLDSLYSSYTSYSLDSSYSSCYSLKVKSLEIKKVNTTKLMEYDRKKI